MRTSSGRKPHALDAQIGQRLRLRRLVMGIPLKEFGPQMGVSYQQLQKYEKGTNKLTAGQLYDVAQLLGVGPSYFFEDVEDLHLPIPAREPDAGIQEEAMPFLVAFSRIERKEHRTAIKRLLAALAKRDSASPMTVAPGEHRYLDS
jgi:transcriptional regulator with XRE-family HTH domain